MSSYRSIVFAPNSTSRQIQIMDNFTNLNLET